jgi:uroporphyrinogen-III decarboxylase
MWPDRVRRLEQWAEAQERGDAVVWITLDGFFWWPRMLFGIERHLYAFYDHPELMHRMNDDMVEWQLAVVEEVAAMLRPDFVTFAEDMSYNHGPMLSAGLFEEFMKPYYDRVVPRLHDLGCVCIVDSDGDVTEAAPWFESAGLDGILPLERQAGVDVAELRRRHPRMRFVGCFDKMTMDRGEAAMRAEFERLLPVAAGGGFILSVDHQTPPGVSYEQYELYLRLFSEYAAEAGRLSRGR